jgi:hypothetical protein
MLKYIGGVGAVLSALYFFFGRVLVDLLVVSDQGKVLESVNDAVYGLTAFFVAIPVFALSVVLFVLGLFLDRKKV